MTQILNVLTLIFGLGAWIVPFVALFRKSTSNNGYMLGSFALCTVSLCCQFIQLSNRAASANIADLTVAVVIAATVLSAVTIILNVTLLLKQAEVK